MKMASAELKNAVRSLVWENEIQRFQRMYEGTPKFVEGKIYGLCVDLDAGWFHVLGETAAFSYVLEAINWNKHEGRRAYEF